MDKDACDDPKVDIPLWIIVVFTIAAVTLFVIGGYNYRRQHPKEISYEPSNCLVLTAGYRNHTCKGKHRNYECYSAIWGVLHGRVQPINSTIESETKYSPLHKAMNKTAEYEVNIDTIDEYRSLFYYSDAMT